jgi:hypothetical protein
MGGCPMPDAGVMIPDAGVGEMRGLGAGETGRGGDWEIERMNW